LEGERAIDGSDGGKLVPSEAVSVEIGFSKTFVEPFKTEIVLSPE
jgi:hypothetical protein